MDDADDRYAPHAGIAPKAGGVEDDPLQSMDKSGRGPRRAIAEAVACPLGVQPTLLLQKASC